MPADDLNLAVVYSIVGSLGMCCPQLITIIVYEFMTKCVSSGLNLAAVSA